MRASGTNWQMRPLGELATTTSGGTPSRTRKDYYGGSIPWVKSGELNDDYIFDTEERITEAGLKSSSAKLFPSGTVLIALYGATVGKTSILRIDASTNQAVCGITPGPDLDGGYLRYHLISLRRELLSHRYGGAQPNISQQIVRNQKIAFPPLPEQKKIAYILSTVQRAIEAQERIIQTTTELKKALMHKLFTEGLRHEPQKQTEIGPVPESWEVVALSECAAVQTGIAKGRKVNAEDAVEVPYLRVANVQDGYLDLSEMKTITIRKNEQQRFALQNGDVVLTEGGDFDKLGRGFIWHGQIENCVHQNHVFAVRPDKTQISSEFFAYQSQSPYGKSYFLSVAHKTTNLACINTTKLKAFPVLLPPQDQQEDIVEACSSIDGKIRNTTNKKTQLQELFSTLLHQLMTAQIQVANVVL